MATTLAEVLRHFGPEYLREHTLSTTQARAWRAIVSCRTAALGGQRLACDGCGAQAWRWNSCRNRHCPQCQSRQRDAWRAARLSEMLNVPYCHLVFTLPHEINALAAVHSRWVYDSLMQCTAATLTEFAANPRWLGGIGAFTLVLHTWTQDLRHHLHVHALEWPAGQCSWVPAPTAAAPTAAAAPGSAPSVRPPSCSRCTRCPWCSEASSCRRRSKPSRLVRCRTIRPTPTSRGASAPRRCAATTGWCTPRRLWQVRPRCWTTWCATRTARPSATSGWWRSRATGCACACAPTTPAANARSR